MTPEAKKQPAVTAAPTTGPGRIPRTPSWVVALSLGGLAIGLSLLGYHFSQAGSLRFDGTRTIREGARLQSILDAAAGGATFYLAGRHQGPLILRKSVTLKGLPGATITGSGHGATLRIEGCKGVWLDELLLASERGQQAEGGGTVEIRDATAELSGCRIRGGRNGIVVKGRSEARLRHNTISETLVYGVVFMDRSQGVAFGNRCDDSAGGGFGVVNQANPLLRSNQAARNQAAGLAFLGQARGIAHDNHFEANKGPGILVTGQAAPVIRRNRCEGNAEGALLYMQGARGEASGNQGTGGIGIHDQARPLLLTNRLDAGGAE